MWRRNFKVTLTIFAATLASVTCAAPDPEVETALQRFVDDYAVDPNIQEITFGVDVDGERWTVAARPGTGSEAASAVLSRGLPDTSTFVWTTDRATFERIASGTMSATTAISAAFASDKRPLELKFIHDFKADAEFYQNVFRPLLFHFWTTGQPEIHRFGFDQSRVVHGGHAVPTLYFPGIRSGWYGILPGDHVNQDPRSWTDPWNAMFFIIKGGSAKARIGDKVIDLQDSTMIHVPPNTRHEFWNPGDEPAEMIMVTFGDQS